MSSRVRLAVLTAAAVLLGGTALWLALRFGWLRADTVPVILPETTASLPRGDENAPGDLLTAEVTAETVQAVVGTLVRPDSYSRTLRVESFWAGGNQTWNVQVWQKTGATRIRLWAESGAQAPKNLLILGSEVHVWYEDEGERIAVYPLSDPALGDTLQMLPTYEALRDLEPGQIEDAGYVLLDGAWRILAVTREAATGYRMDYYVSIETGLLEAAERWDGDTLIYRMTAGTADLAAPADGLFLPGGEA